MDSDADASDQTNEGVTTAFGIRHELLSREQ